MLIIELKNIADDIRDKVDLLVEERLLEISQYPTVVVVFSDRESFDDIKATIIEDLKISNDNIFYFGATPYTEAEIMLFYFLISMQKEVVDFKVLKDPTDDISNNIRRILEGDLVFSIIDSICTASRNYDFSRLSDSISLFKKWLRDNISSEILSPILKPLNILNKLCDFERSLLIGHDNNSIAQISSILEKESYLRESNLREEIDVIIGLIAGYQIENNINKRKNYLTQHYGYRRNFRSDLDNGKTPWILIWYVSLFLLRSKYYHELGDYSASLAMSIRALELYSKASLLSHNDTACGFSPTNKRFYIEYPGGNERTISGVTPLWNKVKSIHVISRNSSVLDNIIKCRNKSTFGHGLSSCNASVANTAYNEVIETISHTSFYNQPSPRTGKTPWDVVWEKTMINPFEKAPQLIGAMSIAMLSTR